MNILVVHNEYGAYSGEEVACYSQFNALKKEHKVFNFFVRASRTPKTVLSKVHAFFSGIFSFSSFLKIIFIIRKEKIAIVHFHNIYPWISISGVVAAKLSGAKVVFSLHNFKHICPSATLSHRGHLYLHSLENGAFNTVLDNVQDSLFKSLGYYLRFASERFFKLERFVDSFVFVSDLQLSIYRKYNKAFSEKGIVIPNFLTEDTLEEISKVKKSYSQREFKVAYVGRPTPEKGFEEFILLVKNNPGVSFFMYGPRPSTLKEPPINLFVKGKLQRSELFESLSKLDVLVVPAVTYETFSIAALEALALGLQVVVTDKVGIASYARLFNNLHVLKSDLSNFSLNLDFKNVEDFIMPSEFTEEGFLIGINKIYGSLK